MEKDLKEALELIKNICIEHKNCIDCPLAVNDLCLTNCYLPLEWKLD